MYMYTTCTYSSTGASFRAGLGRRKMEYAASRLDISEGGFGKCDLILRNIELLLMTQRSEGQVKIAI